MHRLTMIERDGYLVPECDFRAAFRKVERKLTVGIVAAALAVAALYVGLGLLAARAW